MNSPFYLILFPTLFLSCNLPVEDKIEINYFGQTPPEEAPLIFAKNIISQSDRWEGNANFSSGGKEFYFNVFQDSIKTIYRSRYIGGKWENPAPFEAIGGYNNWEPFISLNGNSFYFVSSRPPGAPEWNGRIWKMERSQNNNWSKPVLVDLGFSTEGGYWFPNTSTKGDLYFGGNFPEVGNKGLGDLYYWNAEEDEVYNLERLNTPSEEWDPFIAPDGSYVLWASDREGGFGGTDLYISFWENKNNNWGRAINLGNKINTPDYEVAARITPDGKYMFFDRPIKGTQDIYWVSTTDFEKLKNN